MVSNDKSLKSKPLQIAYEEIRLVPSSSLLQELDRIELGGELPQVKEASTQIVRGTDQPNSEPEDELAQPESTYIPAEVLDDITPESPLDPFDTEFSLWSTHQSCYSTADI